MEIREYTEYSRDEIQRLYSQVGWTAYTEDLKALEQGFKNSLLVLASFENDELLGIIRVVGDGFTVILVQDILVFPQYQRQGIGTALLKAVLDRYSHVRQIQLVTDNTPQTVAFYKSLGFSDFFSARMLRFYERLTDFHLIQCFVRETPLQKRRCNHFRLYLAAAALILRRVTLLFLTTMHA